MFTFGSVRAGLHRLPRWYVRNTTTSLSRAETAINDQRWYHKWYTTYVIAGPLFVFFGWKSITDVCEKHGEEVKLFPWPHVEPKDKSLMPLYEERKPTDMMTTIHLLWEKFFFEDPDERLLEREAHLRKMQRHRELFLEEMNKKRPPLQPMNIYAEMKRMPCKKDASEIDN